MKSSYFPSKHHQIRCAHASTLMQRQHLVYVVNVSVCVYRKCVYVSMVNACLSVAAAAGNGALVAWCNVQLGQFKVHHNIYVTIDGDNTQRLYKINASAFSLVLLAYNG